MALRCPSCQADNTDDARQCASCGGKIARRPRRRAADPDDVEGRGSTLGSPVTAAAFRCAVYGLIPGLGLVLGPAAVVLALLGYRQERAGPPRKGRSPALGVLTLGAAVLVTNWVGVLLMIYGLTAAAP
jgi:hypothetical protein